jgi:hypothetical protein
MRRKLMILLALTSLMPIAIPTSANIGTTIVYIDPPLITGLSIGETFAVNVTVANATDLYAWSFQICYKSEILNASRWTLGSFFESPSAVNITAIWTDNFNETHGLIQIDFTFLGKVPTFNGTTTLATVYFMVKSYGFTSLHLQNTLLLDDSQPFPQEMPHTTADGIVRISQSDIAVIQIALSKNIVNDTIVRINVTVANYGARTETFNVTLYYNSTEITTQVVKDLTPSTSLILTFTWDTTPVPKGKYTIRATAHPLPSETNTEDNTFTDGIITETIQGDVDGNFEVNIVDIATIAKAYGATPGHPLWNPNADFDDNNKIDIIDIAKAAKNYGKKI